MRKIIYPSKFQQIQVFNSLIKQKVKMLYYIAVTIKFNISLIYL